ncbi:MAG: threonine/serine exporter family protein [Ruminococcaceae bacterium]|nr:threonine/serine exporter family protein [Oscillospiraceae bacterium]
MQKLFSNAMDIGEQMLICGAEVRRVEDTVRRMCSAFGAKRTDVFIIPSSMVVTVYMPNSDTYTMTRRITAISTDIEKLHNLNNLSRRICSKKDMASEDIHKEFKHIMSGKAYPFWVGLFSYMIIAGAFAIFFGGGLADALAALMIGGVMRIVTVLLEHAKMNQIFIKFVCAFGISTFALGFMKMGLISSIDSAIIGNIMYLIPTIGLTNGLRDLFAGDSVAGLIRLIEAILNALGIAAGYFLFTFLLGGALV